MQRSLHLWDLFLCIHIEYKDTWFIAFAKLIFSNFQIEIVVIKNYSWLKGKFEHAVYLRLIGWSMKCMCLIVHSNCSLPEVRMNFKGQRSHDVRGSSNFGRSYLPTESICVHKHQFQCEQTCAISATAYRSPKTGDKFLHNGSVIFKSIFAREQSTQSPCFHANIDIPTKRNVRMIIFIAGFFHPKIAYINECIHFHIINTRRQNAHASCKLSNSFIIPKQLCSGSGGYDFMCSTHCVQILWNQPQMVHWLRAQCATSTIWNLWFKLIRNRFRLNWNHWHVLFMCCAYCWMMFAMVSTNAQLNFSSATKN